MTSFKKNTLSRHAKRRRAHVSGTTATLQHRIESYDLPKLGLVFLFFCYACLPKAEATLYQVGSTRAYTNLQAVTSLLLPGDIVEVDGDQTYEGNVRFYHGGTAELPVIVNGIRVNGRRPILTANNFTILANVVSFRTNHIRFAGFEIDGKSNPLVARGLYNVGHDIIIRDTVVHDCPLHGIHGSDLSGSMTLDSVEVFHCGSGTKRHPVYVATDNTAYPTAVFRMNFCYLHDNTGGNSVKSRASRNEIYYNWIEGAAYHELDLIGADPTTQAPNTARRVREDSDVVGNIICKNSNSQGSVARVGDDGTGSSNGRYRFVNNTIITAPTYTIALFKVRGPRESLELHNNVFYRVGGKGVCLIDSANPAMGANDHISGRNNWLPENSSNISPGLTDIIWGTDPGMANVAERDYSPTNGSPLLDVGKSPTESPVDFPFLNPQGIPAYLPPLHSAPVVDMATTRLDDGLIDLGAIEAPLLPPGIITQPTSQTALLARPVEFAVVAAGSHANESPLSYQWYFNDAIIHEATNTAHHIESPSLEDVGNYTVTISNIFGAITSTPARLNITLDLTPPTVGVNYPLQSVLNTSGELTLAGVASDNVEVHDIMVSVNDADAWQSAETLVANTTNTLTWHTHLALTPGTNIIRVVGVDNYENVSPTITRSYYYQAKTVLGVSLVGNGNVNGEYSTFGTPANGAILDINRTYSATAKPHPGNLFSNWLASVDGQPPTQVSTTAKYSFRMQSNLTLIAQFVTNQFIRAAGQYYGLFYNTNEITPDSAGNFCIKVTDKQQFSGKLNVAGEAASFAGTFDIAGKGCNLQPVIFKSRSQTLTVRLELPFDGSDTIAGTVSNNNGSWVANLRGDRDIYNNGNPLNSMATKHTLIIPPTIGLGDNPGGFGAAIVSISASGYITAQGSLGDSTIFKQSAPISKNGDWPFYWYGYPVMTEGIKVNQGIVIGWLSLTNGLNGTLAWIKQSSPADACYPDGFTNFANIITSTYQPPAASNRVINLFDGRGSAVLEGGNLLETLTNLVVLSPFNKFTASNTNGMNLRIDAKTGLITGYFRHPENTNMLTTIRGIVLQNLNQANGNFRASTASGSFQLRERYAY